MRSIFTSIIYFVCMLFCIGVYAQQTSYTKGAEGSVHIWISEHGASNGYLFQAYDFDRMEERGINSGFQGTYKTIEIGEQEYTSENLQAVYRLRWATNFTWLNWSDASISAMTQSYHPTWDETPLSVNEYRKLYGSWFTLVGGANSYLTPEYVEFRNTEGGEMLTGWGLPGIEDICQLIGQAPRNSNSVHWDVLNFIGASNNDIPSNHNSQWYGEFNNISGLTLTPLGSREPNQGNLSNFLCS